MALLWALIVKIGGILLATILFLGVLSWFFGLFAKKKNDKNEKKIVK